ncbi:amino acid transporter [Plakobranchus ocellatus]|uniref:Amino acid transporter n=1 Tax=Plakobranchus ocellatus TaxID=259542 RepID=A0AAV4ACV6_9GAST|nr:amino acid transporter [Plakobranchus ocellatus]
MSVEQQNPEQTNIDTLPMEVLNNIEGCHPSRQISHDETGNKSKLMEWVKTFLKENCLILLTLVGIAVGFALGLGLQNLDPSPDLLQWLGLPGELFLRGLKATIVPIVVCMVITATSSLDPTINRRIAIVAVGTFFFTAVLAVIVAIILFFLLKPDANSLLVETTKRFGTRLGTQDVFLDLIRNIFPDNIVGAAISQAVTEYKPEDKTSVNASTNATETEVIYKKSLGQTQGVNILGLITICAAVGAAANKSLRQDSAFLSFFRQGQQIVLQVMHWLNWTTPVGVASLVAQSIASVSDISAVFYSIGRLVICVVVGLTFHQLVTLPAILAVLWRKNPFMFLARCVKPFFVGFAATATAVALPHMLEASIQNGVSVSVSEFVIPMSVSLHADASALYIASASLFVAQTSGEDDLDAGSIFIIAALSSVLSLAIPSVPSASIVTIVIILTSLNVPLHGIALLFTVEWLLDRLRTGVNATSHVICSAYTDAICNVRKQRVTEATHVRENTWDMEVRIESEPWIDQQDKDQISKL